MTDLVHAFTEHAGPSPAYVNVTKTPDGVRLTVRTRGAEGGSVIMLTPEQARRLGQDLVNHAG